MTNEQEESRRALWNEGNRIRIDATYSGRGHQIVAQRWSFVSKLIGLPAAIIGAVLSSTAALTALLGSGKVVTAALALAAAAFISARAFLRPDELAEKHGLKGNHSMNVASDATRFQDVSLKLERDIEVLRQELERLAERRNSLRLENPRHIPRWAYERAKKGIEAGESDHEGDYLWRDWPV